MVSSHVDFGSHAAMRENVSIAKLPECQLAVVCVRSKILKVLSATAKLIKRPRLPPCSADLDQDTVEPRKGLSLCF